MLVPFNVPAGVYKNGTEYQSKGRWNDSNLIRFFDGTIRPIGGWRNVLGGSPSANLQVTGKARGAHSWRDNSTNRYLAIGTHTKLFARNGTVAGLLDITPSGLVVGNADSGTNIGYGSGAYGVDTYGTPRQGNNINQLATTWSFDNFGAFLLAVQSDDGKLYYWDLMTATAVPVTATSGTTPINNKGVIVTDERFVFLLQAGGNRRRIAWSDQENLFNWQITATTQAGDFEIQTSGEIQCARRVRGQVLILTTTDAHVSNYLGPPLVYGFERVGTGCGAISRNAVIASDNAAIWMSDNQFFIYDGYVKPLMCEVADYVFGRLNRSQVAKIWAVHNSDFGEVTFYYPSTIEIDSYVTYNYREGHWAVGNIQRTTGVDNSVFLSPIRVDANGFLYEHEVSFQYGGAMPYLTSGPVEIGEGQQVYMVKYMYPDEKTQGNVQARFATKFYPNDTQYNFGPYSMANPTPLRFTGRQVAVRIEGIVNTDWRVGLPRFDVEVGGMR